MPPIGEQAWQEEFAKYRQTPEYIQINTDMTLPEYQYIFYIEWIHRLIARLAGLAYAIPVFYFLLKRIIPWKEFGMYFLMGMLFISQAFAGWIMVASGLVDRPAVSHFNLTIHLLLALTLLGSCGLHWSQYGFPDLAKKPT
jgi:cytochrome c oxidase assembly protein subunit 15